MPHTAVFPLMIYMTSYRKELHYVEDMLEC